MENLGLTAPALVLALSLTACQVDDLPTRSASSSPVVVSASADEPRRTRSAVEHRGGSYGLADALPVKAGELSFSYSMVQNDAAAPVMAVCRFEDGIGKVYRGSSPLQWKNIGGAVDSKATFTLDNVDEMDIDASTVAFNSKGELVGFGPDWSSLERPGKYDAAEELTAQGQVGLGNDVLWGEAVARYGSHTEERVNSGTDTPMHFEMTHRMSRLCVQLVNLTGDLRNENVRIKLTRIITHPVGFNRASGEVLLPEDRSDESIYNDLVLYDGVPGGTGDELTTPNFILPPEEDLYRRGSKGIEMPRLVISVGQRTFSARIPQSMIYDESVNQPGSDSKDYSVNLNFRASHHLTLRAKLIESADQPIIEFMPVMVERWDYVFSGTIRVGKSEDSIAGAFSSAADLDSFIDLYNAQTPQVRGISYDMVRSGAVPRESYHYVAGDDFFSGGDAEYEQETALRRRWTIRLQPGSTDFRISGMFNPDYCRTKYYNSYDESKVFGIYPVEIEFNGNTINGCSTTAELLGIGIRTKADLETCIEWYNKADKVDRRSYFTRFLQFGTYEKYKDSSGVEHCMAYIDLIGDITDWPKSFTRFRMKDWAPFEFRFNGHTIKGIRSENDLKE